MVLSSSLFHVPASAVVSITLSISLPYRMGFPAMVASLTHNPVMTVPTAVAYVIAGMVVTVGVVAVRAWRADSAHSLLNCSHGTSVTSSAPSPSSSTAAALIPAKHGWRLDITFVI